MRGANTLQGLAKFVVNLIAPRLNEQKSLEIETNPEMQVEHTVDRDGWN